jgi:DNA-binding transcriptional regulator YiaG
LAWLIEFERTAEKELQRLDKQVALRIVKFLRERVAVLDNPSNLNTSESTIEKWESGAKRPSGMALKLLDIVEKHGLKVLA